MRLRIEGLRFIIVAAIGLFLLVAAVGRWVLLPAADTTDEEDMRLRLARLESRLGQELAEVKAFAHDYGAWSDTLEFVRGKLANYAEINQEGDYLRVARMDMFGVWDARGELRALTTPGGEVDGGVAEALGREVERFGVQIGKGLSGLVRTPAGVVLFAAAAVTDETFAPPAEGVFLVARRLTPELLARLSVGGRMLRS
jgi:sensor domain CHASE-containing protein